MLRNLKLTKSGHLLLEVIINGMKLNFVVDTGANHSCIDSRLLTQIGVTSSDSGLTAVGMGGSTDAISSCDISHIKLGRTKFGIDLLAMDLTQVVEVFDQYNVYNIAGIIGSDFLIKNKADISYWYKTIQLC